MKASPPFLLLDLHFTFAIDETWHRGTRLISRIPAETYRFWIADLAFKSDATVIMTTARPEAYLEATRARILDQLGGWEPHDYFFRQLEDVRPHVAKEHNLDRIIAKYGEPQPNWVGFESNDRTRSMYKKRGIYSLPVHRLPEPLTAFPPRPATWKTSNPQ